jgi:hypothetical protein
MDRLHQAGRVGAWERAIASAATGACLTAAALVAAGCNQPPAVNPWHDDSIPSSVYGTASSEAVAAANKAPAIRVRDIPPTPAPIARPDVPHYPLWWEDPFEDQGDNNDTFAWTWQDYLDMPYGLARFILNTVGWPASAVVTLPGTPMVSDGVVEKVHDAKKGISPDPRADYHDFEQLNGTTAAEQPYTPGPPAEPQPASARPAGSQPAA